MVLSCKCKFIFHNCNITLLSVTSNLAIVIMFLVNAAVFHNCDYFVQLQVYFLIIVTYLFISTLFICICDFISCNCEFISRNCD